MKIAILGTRGIPARHGGFETFAERLALYLASRKWDVTVYCQEDGSSAIGEDRWNNIRRVNVPGTCPGAAGTVYFDWKSTLHASREKGLKLTLGYNTAVFCFLYRLRGQTNYINMDGLEWRRSKWSFLEKAWLYVNERAGCWLGNHLVADHPEIKAHLAARASSRKITVIPYGADRLAAADASRLQRFGLIPHQYLIVIARPEPENSITDIVTAFSSKKRQLKLVVMGRYEPATNSYHRQAMEAASDEVLFIGAHYEKELINALRYYARLYIHGHQVGGTNPSLVEALGAGLPVLAHDNVFNRWVAGPGACYFNNATDCGERLDYLLADEPALRKMREASLRRHGEEFTWDRVLAAYEALLLEAEK
jgi:glycosyltransferase involved in cell wall biosynthesis